MNKIAVIGGSGFIGAHTVVELKNDGYDVTVLDITPPKIEGVDFKYCNIKYQERVDECFCLGEYDAVYCLAGIIFAGDCSADPENAFDTNIRGLKNVLNSCVKYKVKRLLFSSTVHAYENCNPSYLTVDEDTPLSTNINTNLYISSKIIGEQLVRCYNAEYGLSYTIFRYGVAYGINGHANSVINAFLNNAVCGVPVKIYGSGTSTRNYLYVTDHARGNVSGLLTAAENKVINLDSDETISTLELVDIIKDVIKKDITIEYAGARKNDYNGRMVNCDKALDVLKWQPMVSLRQGIAKMYNHMLYHNC